MPSLRASLYLIAAYCLALIGAALYLQHVQNLLPCPLCVLQRYAYLGIALFAVIGAAVNKPKLGAALGLISAGIGIGTVAKHLYVLAHPGFSCGIDPLETSLNKIPTATYMPWLFQADGLCENATDTVLGLTVPQWSAVGFGIVTVALLAVWLRARARR